MESPYESLLKIRKNREEKVSIQLMEINFALKKCKKVVADKSEEYREFRIARPSVEAGLFSTLQQKSISTQELLRFTNDIEKMKAVEIKLKQEMVACEENLDKLMALHKNKKYELSQAVKTRKKYEEMCALQDKKKRDEELRGEEKQAEEVVEMLSAYT